jgi:hypothetical protein
MNKAERLWNLRDGVLAWLYGLRIDGARVTHADPAVFMAATSWSDAEVTSAELTEAVRWLKKEGYADGKDTFQGVILHPSLTPYGEKYAASGKSVRDLPGVADVQNPYLHIEHSTGVAVAFHSPGATQNVNIQQKIEQAHALADAIERALPAVSDDPVRASAEELVTELRTEAHSADSKPGRLKALATTAMTSIATAAGTEAGKAIIEAALPLLS